MTQQIVEQARLREPSWPRSAIRTAHGHMIDLADPQPESVYMTDIATSLAHQERFTGHCPLRPTIAQHSLAVEHIAVRLAGMEAVANNPTLDVNYRALSRAALLHDGAEAYVSDLSSPAKWALRPLLTGAAARSSDSTRAVTSAFDKLEALAMAAIVARFDCTAGGWEEIIHEADMLARIYEAAYEGWSAQAARDLPDWLKRDTYVARCYSAWAGYGPPDGGEAAFLRRAHALGMADGDGPCQQCNTGCNRCDARHA